MDVTLEKTSDLEGRIVVKIEEGDYAPRVKKELKEIGNTRQIPGFRKGHIDMAQLQKRFGKDVKAHVLNDVASDAALKYIDDNNIAILGQPIPAPDQELNLDEKDYTFAYEIGLMPELNLVFDQSVELDFYNRICASRPASAFRLRNTATAPSSRALSCSLPRTDRLRPTAFR